MGTPSTTAFAADPSKSLGLSGFGRSIIIIHGQLHVDSVKQPTRPKKVGAAQLPVDRLKS